MIHPINPISAGVSGPAYVPGIGARAQVSGVGDMAAVIVLLRRVLEMMQQMLKMLEGGAQAPSAFVRSGYSGGTFVNITNNVNMVQYGSGGDLVQAVNIGTAVDFTA